MLPMFRRGVIATVIVVGCGVVATNSMLAGCCDDGFPDTTTTTQALVILNVRIADKGHAYFIDALSANQETLLQAFRASPSTSTLSALTDSATAAPSSGAARVFWSVGTEVTVLVVFDPGDECPPAIHVNEVSRNTQLLNDLIAIAKTVFGKLQKGADVAVRFRMTTVRLKEVRAALEISARSVPKAGGSCNVAEKECAGDKCTFVSASVVTGPKEHMFLSVDLPMSKTSDLKYDSVSKTLVPKTAPTKVYVGVNWMVGDVVAPSAGSWSRPLDRIVLKAFIEASAKPSESFGVALAFRLPPIKTFAIDSLQVFGGYVWRRQDAVSVAGQPQRDNSYQAQLRWGLGFDVGKLKDWLTPK